MSHPLLPILRHQSPIFLSRPDAEALPPLHHDQKHRGHRQADEGRGDEAVLIAQVTDPGRDPGRVPNISIQSIFKREGKFIPVSDRERHGVPYDNHRRHGLAAQLPVAVDHVVDTDGDAGGVAERQHPHGEDQAEPVHLVRRADPPQE